MEVRTLLNHNLSLTKFKCIKNKTLSTEVIKTYVCGIKTVAIMKLRSTVAVAILCDTGGVSSVSHITCQH